jgi:hypothetical protein
MTLSRSRWISVLHVLAVGAQMRDDSHAPVRSQIEAIATMSGSAASSIPAWWSKRA